MVNDWENCWQYAKGTNDIDMSTSKNKDLAASIAEVKAEFDGATKVRAKETADVAETEAEFVDAVDMLDHAIGILEQGLAKNPAFFAQIYIWNMQRMLSTIGQAVEATTSSVSGKQKLLILLQSNSDGEDNEPGVPAATIHKTQQWWNCWHSG